MTDHDASIHGDAAAYVAGALTADEAREFEAHLESCPTCGEEVAAMREVTARLSDSVAADPPTSLRAAVLDQIAHTPQLPGSDSTTETNSDGPDGPEMAAGSAGSAGSVSHIGDRRLPRTLYYLVAAAAVVVVLAAIGWGVNSQHQVDIAQSQQQQLTRLLASADVQTFSTHVRGGGTATVVVSDHLDRAVLVTHDLPSLSDGRVYQMWTITDTAAPAGTFTPTGSDVVRLPAAATQAKSVAMTVEPAGGSAQPTSKPVFAVSLTGA